MLEIQLLSTFWGLNPTALYEICRSKTSFRPSFFSSLAPSIRQDNSFTSRTIVADSPSDGHRKCPRSKRLKCSQKPSPSHSIILSLFRFRLQNTKSAFAKGSSEKLSCTNVINPLIDFLISVYPQHRYTGLSFHLIPVTSKYDKLFLAVQDLSQYSQ